jgi:hypothetical protein
MQSETNFAKCDRVFGEINIRADHPIQHFKNVIVDDWAVYDSARRIIPESGYYRGIPSLTALRGAPFTGYHPARVRNSLPDAPYFYLGHIAHHFGHFIVGTLSRLWPFCGFLPTGTPILYYGPPPAELFETEYVRACFDALGITQDQMIRIDGKTPLRVANITIADSAFYENFSI